MWKYQAYNWFMFKKTRHSQYLCIFMIVGSSITAKHLNERRSEALVKQQNLFSAWALRSAPDPAWGAYDAPQTLSRMGMGVPLSMLRPLDVFGVSFFGISNHPDLKIWLRPYGSRQSSITQKWPDILPASV